MSTLDKFQKLQVVKRTTNFREGTQLVEASLPLPPAEGTVYVRNTYMGVNATDVNVTGGAYGASPLPHDCGLEGMGEVVAVAADVTNIKTGDSVMYFSGNAYAEFSAVPAKACVTLTPTEAADPSTVLIPVSVLTAACAVGEEAQPKAGEVALVTAAAGGTGQIAVQLLKKQYGCRVIGTCSTPEKAAFLRDTLGCDDVINYRTESLDEALTRLAPDGLNIVYECVGGDTLKTCLAHMAVKGRLVMIGAVDTYLKKPAGGEAAAGARGPGLFTAILKSVSLRGFLLSHYADTFPKYLQETRALRDEGKLVLKVDDTASFTGLAQVADAVEHLHSGKSFGKVIVKV